MNVCVCMHKQKWKFYLSLFFSVSRSWLEQVIFLSGFKGQKKRALSQISQIPSSMIPLITNGNVEALSKCSLVYS